MRKKYAHNIQFCFEIQDVLVSERFMKLIKDKKSKKFSDERAKIKRPPCNKAGCACTDQFWKINTLLALENDLVIRAKQFEEVFCNHK